MAHGVAKRAEGKGLGSRRIFAPHFKLQVLDSYRNDADCKGNQRATARKYGIHRRQIQKWLQVEGALRSSVKEPENGGTSRLRDAAAPRPPTPPMDLSLKRAAPAPPSPWDLTTTKRRRDDGSAPKPKLFKPYLDDVEPEVEERKPPSVPPCCSAYYNNNNEIKSEYCNNTYTLLELQPNNSVSYYYYPAPYPGPDYEGPYYEDPNYPSVPLKQRHSYSLDFKLSAIECYYQDSVCKGNQRAVATKYNVHRRQVQKWLKQADELREKNEIVKQTVR